ncbi:MAG: hypothetical protein IKC50_06330 [Oscillospiraceae bacterium]|nr:hypothetical protein [Oscillospiraceae bacterium]MBR2977867.1 hypothetical protein [Oscillospiraceae bacterium]
MKYCQHCGAEVHEKAVVCVKCGCAIPNTNADSHASSEKASVVDVITQRIKINAIIWLVIGCIQIMLGLSVNWLLIVVGSLNLITAFKDLNYSQSFPKNPVGIVANVTPLTSAIVTLIYNLIFGGVIGVAGSIYYLLGVRGYVLENERAFLEIENQYVPSK